jgi:hypothetical protein
MRFGTVRITVLGAYIGRMDQTVTDVKPKIG